MLNFRIVVKNGAWSEIYYHGSIELSKKFKSEADGFVSTLPIDPCDCKCICQQLEDHGLEYDTESASQAMGF